MQTLTPQATSIHGTLTRTFRVWGTDVDVHIDPVMGRERWKPRIRHPFHPADLVLRVGINEKILDMAQEREVELIIGNRVISAPTKRVLRGMVRRKEYEIVDGYFNKPFKVYHFILTK